MLKYRLLFGTLMSIIFVGLILLDGLLDGSLTSDRYVEILPIQASLLALIIAIIATPAQLELSNLIKQTQATVFVWITIPATILIATNFYWSQFLGDGLGLHYSSDEELLFILTCLILAFSLLGLFFVQAVKFGTEGTIRNVSTSFFSIIYLGFLCSFILGIRIDYGPWALLMFISTVKGSDIGAYTLGRLFGKHKLCPSISPGKTYEGLSGAALFGIVASLGFSWFSGIISLPWALGFGAVFGVLGQLGDLVESMIKRDAALKDSSSSIPGFGGLLDVLDSPLATAPVAFAFFFIYEQLHIEVI